VERRLRRTGLHPHIENLSSPSVSVATSLQALASSDLCSQHDFWHSRERRHTRFLNQPESGSVLLPNKMKDGLRTGGAVKY
jgi:hypothetical protein